MCAVCALGVHLSSLAVPPDLPRVEALVLERTNDFRRAQALPPVARDDRLDAAAQSFADFMARTAKYGHEADGSTPFARAKRHGYDYCIVSENIAYQYDSRGFTTADLARDFVEGWKKSPGHRKNMLDRDVAHTAIAVAQGKRDHYYAVQMFGRPRSMAVEFHVRNAADTPARYSVGDESFTLPPGARRQHTQCREATISLGGTFDARNGSRFVIARERNQLTLRRE